jgi:hypothetical protein
MATQNKTTENKTSVKDFLNTVADEAKRKEFNIKERRIMNNEQGIMNVEVTKRPCFLYFFIHYSLFDIQYYFILNGREGDMPLAAFSPHKGSDFLYLSANTDKGKELLKKFGKHKTGKSCPARAHWRQAKQQDYI